MNKQRKIWDELYSKEENKWKRETNSFKGKLKGKIVLELGAGNGKTLKSILRDKPKEVYSVDFSKSAINICKNQFSDENLKLSVANITDLPFSDNYFDVVICYYVLNNLTFSEQKKAISEIYRGLKINGSVLFEDFAKGDFRDDGKHEKNGLVKNYFDVNELNRLFSAFSDIQLKVKEFSSIKSDKRLKRRIVYGIIKK